MINDYRLRPASSLISRRPQLLVPDPQLMQPGQLRHLQEQVRTVTQRVPARGGLGDEAFRLDRDETLIPHEFSHAPRATRIFHVGQILHDAPRSVATLVLPKDLMDQGRQLRIALFADRWILRQA